MLIEPLADHRDAIPMLTAWYETEWPAFYGAGGRGDARADLLSRCRVGGLPMGLVAVENAEVLGTAALDLDRASQRTPAIVALLVTPSRRGQGIGTALVAAAEAWARKLGYVRVYVSSSVLDGMLRARGWQVIDVVTFLSGERGTVYELTL